MAPPKGFRPPNAGIGRKKGVPNKATKTAREMFAMLVEDNLPRLQGWIDRIGEKDPEKATRLILDAAEYHVPKLARTELAGSVEVKMPKTVILTNGDK